MFKKTLLFSVICFNLFSNSTFASTQTTLNLANLTNAPGPDFPSVAIIDVGEKTYSVCSKGFKSTGCVTHLAVTLPANQPIDIDIIRWVFGNGEHPVEASCHHQKLTLLSGESRDFVMQAADNKIECSIQ